MSITKETVKKLGRLARLHIEEQDLEAKAEEVNGIMGWIEQLGELNTDGVEPLTGVSDMALKQRKDEVTDGNIQTQVLANAPETSQGYYVVQKIIE